MVIMQVCTYTLPCRFSLLVTLTILSGYLDAFQNSHRFRKCQFLGISQKKNVHPVHACSTVLTSASFFININFLPKEKSVLSLSGLNLGNYTFCDQCSNGKVLAHDWTQFSTEILQSNEILSSSTGFQNTSFLGTQEPKLCR